MGRINIGIFVKLFVPHYCAIMKIMTLTYGLGSFNIIIIITIVTMVLTYILFIIMNVTDTVAQLNNNCCIIKTIVILMDFIWIYFWVMVLTAIFKLNNRTETDLMVYIIGLRRIIRLIVAIVDTGTVVVKFFSHGDMSYVCKKIPRNFQKNPC